MVSVQSFRQLPRMMQQKFPDTLKAICEAVSIPVVAIGGITQGNVVKLAGSGIDGVAVISAIYAQKDIKKATADLKEAVKAIV